MLRLAIVVVGILLPYLARLSKSFELLSQYVFSNVFELLFFQGFNALTWGSIILTSFFYESDYSILAPALTGFGYISWAHYTLDLTVDAQAGLGIIFIPIYSIPYVVIGGIIGYLIDLYLR
jgi:hypothetical protein